MRASKVLLMSCRSPFLDDSKVYPPLANLYLKAYLQQHVPGLHVTVAGEGSGDSDVAACEEYDVIGISVMTPQRAQAVALARAIKARWPAKTVVMGGPHVRGHHEALAKAGVADVLVTHDGERALAAICAGTAVSGVISDTLSRQDLLEAPRPDRRSSCAAALLSEYRYELAGRRATTMMTARGCPELCTFCEEAATNVRRSSLDSVCGQLDDIAALGYGGVYLFDDLFALSVKTMTPICRALSHRDLVYRCNVQARYFVRDGDTMASLLADTGCVEVAFGAESGSQQILDAVKKRCTVAQNYRTVEAAKRHGLHVKAFILLGLPGESLDTLRDTERFLADSGVDDFQCAVYMPFRGTEIRQRLDDGDDIDLQVVPRGADGDVTGAYGIQGGQTAYEVRTRALSEHDIKAFRDDLVARLRPRSHRRHWETDRFFDEAAWLA